MSAYTQEQQTAIVEDAMNLTAVIESEERELRRLRREEYDDKPIKPSRVVINRKIQIKPDIPKPPRAKYSFSEYINEKFKPSFEKLKPLIKKVVPIAIIVAVILILISFLTKSEGLIVAVLGLISFILSSLFTVAVWFVIIYFILYLKTLVGKNIDLKNSSEYKQAVADAERVAKEQENAEKEKIRLEQEQLDAKYEKELAHYNNVVLPEYNYQKELWQDIQNKKIAIIEADLDVNQQTLDELYDKTKLISATYRDLVLLSWLYEDMSTSDHDIRYATELLDRDRQRVATENVSFAVRNMEHTMRQGFSAVYEAIENGNDIQNDMLITLDSTRNLVSKTRRDMNVGTAVSAVQRNKTNKLLDGKNN